MIKEYFNFKQIQRKGILGLFLLIIVLQTIYYCVDFSAVIKNYPEKKKWLSLQADIDLLKKEKGGVKVFKMYPFNPNFITDYKGYKLGMTVQEIDRLLDFRKDNKYVNSPIEFQKVTKISDSLLNAISPFFKFPDWVTNKKEFKGSSFKEFPKKEKIIEMDINLASKEDLIKIYGIGEAISLRILKQKESLGGFVSMEQMKDVWGLSPEVIDNLNSHFKIIALPKLKLIDINNASIKELSQFPYFKYTLAKQIVIYRSMNGAIEKTEDLIKIKGFPVEKANIIALYLLF